MLTHIFINKRNIFITGSPDIDILLKETRPPIKKVKKRYDIKYLKEAKRTHGGSQSHSI